jgi:NAD(P)-dependent dehydrogenase (short-subunit alcohol dehydrogenase family)
VTERISLEGKVAVVTGAGRGLGSAYVELLTERGARVVVNDLGSIEHFGRIDLLVNNAGICGSQLFEDATLDDFDHYWRVHLGGPVNTVKAAWPHMVALSALAFREQAAAQPVS